MGSWWQHKHVRLLTDNTTVMHAINKGSTRNPVANSMLKEILWIAAIHNCYLKAKFISSEANVLADGLSRAHNDYYRQKGLNIYNSNCDLLHHMSVYSLLSYFFRDMVPTKATGF
jgi:hypothetical protein